MRMIVFFDLPVKKKEQQRAATQFRNFLLKDGYVMVQYSVYSRVCCGYDSVEMHAKRLRMVLPPHGSIRLLTVTEKQYEAIEILLGENKAEEQPVVYEQLTLL